MSLKPILDNIELQLVQNIEGKEKEILAQYSVPALEGDFLQDLGRRATRIKLTGVMTGFEAREGLKNLREKFRDAEPMVFIADIATSTKVDKVIIEKFTVRDIAGKPERFEYALTLREYIEPPPVAQEAPPPPPPTPPLPSADQGTLIVEVIVEGQPDFDYGTLTVTVEGTQQDGSPLSRTLTNQSPIWADDNIPPGQYTVKVTTKEPSGLTSTSNMEVRAGQTTKEVLTLQPSRATNAAIGFIVHFASDKAFVEPCMRHVLGMVAEYARQHKDEKLVVVGNTDRRGSEEYNLSLGDRRARSVYAYLTYGRNETARNDSLEEWKLLRQGPDYQLPSVKDHWGTREYQYMLQTLGYYPSNIDGVHRKLTDKAVQDFQQDKPLPIQDGKMHDETWEALIQDYLSLDEAVMDLPESQFLENCPGEILKWLACGEQQPRKTTPDAPCSPDTAWRPNRRTELLFICAETLPRKGQEPKPVTFDLPEDRPVGAQWCLGPSYDLDHKTPRCTFLRSNGDCPPASPDQLCVQPVTTEMIRVCGSINDENGDPWGDKKYVLIAPDGQFMDGEKLCGEDRGRPVYGKTDADGNFSYDNETPSGVYTIEVALPKEEPYIAYDAKRPPATGRGSVVCKWLDAGSSVFDVIVRADLASREKIKPIIKLDSQLVVVKKEYTTPKRQRVILRADPPELDKSAIGKFICSSQAIRFFTAPEGGAEITFNGKDNVLSGDMLNSVEGVQLFAEGAKASEAMDDIRLILSLYSPDLLVGLPDEKSMTSVEVTVDVCGGRPELKLLHPKEKTNPGRYLQIKSPKNIHERALLIIQKSRPESFSGYLVISPINDKVQLFAETDEVPAMGQTPLSGSQIISNSEIPISGKKYWVEGVRASHAIHDTAYKLGVMDKQNILEGDFVSFTVESIFEAPISFLTQNMALLPQSYPIPIVGPAIAGLLPMYKGRDPRNTVIDALILHLQESRPDVVGLTECWLHDERSRIRQELQELYPFAAEGTIENDQWMNGGLLLLSKHTILEIHRTVYQAYIGEDGFSNKGALHVRIEVPNHPSQYDIFLTHLQSCEPELAVLSNSGKGINCNEKLQIYQISQLNAFVHAYLCPHRPALLMGDFNHDGCKENIIKTLIERLGDPKDIWQLTRKKEKGITHDEYRSFEKDNSDTDRHKSGSRYDYFFSHFLNTLFEPSYSDTKIVTWRTNSGRDLSDHYGLETHQISIKEVLVDVDQPIVHIKLMLIAVQCLRETQGTLPIGGGVDEVEFELRYSAASRNGKGRTKRIRQASGDYYVFDLPVTLELSDPGSTLVIELEAWEVDEEFGIETGRVSLGPKKIVLDRKELLLNKNLTVDRVLPILHGGGGEYAGTVRIELTT